MSHLLGRLRQSRIGRLLGLRGNSGLPPVQSDFLGWLRFANAGMLHGGNVDCFQHAVRNLPGPEPMVEIGSFCGLSTNVLTHLKQREGVRNPLITCDRWVFEGSEGGGALGESDTITHAEYRTFVRDTYIRNVSFFSRGDPPFTIEVFSDDFFRLWEQGATAHDVLGRSVRLGGGISFAYIDGNHSYDFARRDFENADRFLVPGGFILFDDSADGSGWDVCRVVAEVRESGRYELVARNPNYFFRKRR